jgi:hypothetical protein
VATKLGDFALNTFGVAIENPPSSMCWIHECSSLPFTVFEQEAWGILFWPRPRVSFRLQRQGIYSSFGSPYGISFWILYSLRFWLSFLTIILYLTCSQDSFKNQPMCSQLFRYNLSSNSIWKSLKHIPLLQAACSSYLFSLISARTSREFGELPLFYYINLPIHSSSVVIDSQSHRIQVASFCSWFIVI